MHNRKHQLGFSLIEVMVAVLILAIGLLGIAGLQAVAKRTNYEAMQRTTATMLAQDIVERMRANPRQINSYLGTVTPGNTVIPTRQHRHSRAATSSFPPGNTVIPARQHRYSRAPTPSFPRKRESSQTNSLYKSRQVGFSCSIN